MLTRGNVKPIYYRILSKFPQNFSFCFAYGSGVKKQLGYGDVQSANENRVVKGVKKSSMIDLIYCVENPHRWHAQNLEKNPSHYSSLQYLGSNFLAQYQENIGARVFCNTLIPIEDEQIMIKYGVITTKHMISDLLDWRDLYVAGRLQKPVEIIKSPTNSKIQNALELNLQNAIHAALLLLPKEFTEYELYYAIANLSYNGDFRMIFGENKSKVENIVRPQLENFRALYATTLKLFTNFLEFPPVGSDNVVCRQDLSTHIIHHHLNQLPKYPIRRIVSDWNKGKYRQDTEDVLRAVAYSNEYQETVRNSLSSIVWQSSISQSLKNIASAGLSKSLKYSSEKAMKTFSL